MAASTKVKIAGTSETETFLIFIEKLYHHRLEKSIAQFADEFVLSAEMLNSRLEVISSFSKIVAMWRFTVSVLINSFSAI